jgi:uncharacterized protein (TIGR02217 family)
MSEYPIPPYPSAEGFIVSPVWKTIIAETDSLKEQRKQKQTYAFYDVALTYDYLSEDDFKTLWAFYMARKGAYEAFYIYDLFVEDHDSIWLGMGDGVTTTFDISGKTTTDHIVYLDGGVLATSNYVIISGGGAENSDRITFTTAPVTGAILTIDFSGYLRIYCRFKEDKLSRESFSYKALKTSIELKGLNYVG